MAEKTNRTLKIDPTFKNLISPLQRKEYLQLEENLIADGCREPIAVWKGVIVDGHNRYEICTKHQIPFAIEEMDFICREEAISWICANQLGRRNISEETRKFLIGKQYDADKIVSKIKNPKGQNQFSGYKSDKSVKGTDKKDSKHLTAAKIARDNNISHSTVEKYAIYSRALDSIAEKDPEIVSKILAGEYKISHENVVGLSKLNSSEIKKFGKNIQRIQNPFIQYKQVRNVISSSNEKAEKSSPTPTIKDMPAFDPDADIIALTLTIPSWASSINRVRTKVDLSIITENARDNLIKELNSLSKHVYDLLSAIKEG